MPSSLTAISSTGARLDADFSLDRTVAGFDVIIESRSGGKRGKARPRNPDYEKLFELVLERAAALEARLDGAWVVSADTASLPADARLLSAPEYPYPVNLSAVTSFRELRTTISGRQGAIGRRAGARGPGNRNRRVLLSFGLAQPPDETELVEAGQPPRSPMRANNAARRERRSPRGSIGVLRRSVKGSCDRPSNIGACNTASSPHNVNPPRGPHSANPRREFAKCPDDGQRAVPQLASAIGAQTSSAHLIAAGAPIRWRERWP